IHDTPSSIALDNDAGQCGAVVTWAPPTATDNCSVTLSSDHSPGDFFPIGTTTVNYLAVDGSGNMDHTSFDVTITDAEPPMITGTPGDIVVSNDAGACSAVVSWPAPTAHDNCPGVTLASDHNPGDTFPVGTTTVTSTATDAHGHVTTTAFHETVNDTENPSI